MRGLWVTAAAAAVMVVLLLLPAPTSANRTSYGRQLLQSGVSCPAQIPACTARRCTTRILDSKEAYVCLRCMTGYRPVKGSDGKSVVQCVCPPGTYQVIEGSSRSCQRCPQGRYCPGGSFRLGSSAASATAVTELAIGGRAVLCAPGGVGMTTKAEGAARYADCIAQGGYVLPAAAGQAPTRCEGNSYAPAGNRLQSCLPCQSGLAVPPTYYGLQVDRNEVCQVPPGRFWELNVVRECPQGLYREEYVRVTERSAIACLSCPVGWQTKAKGATSKRECTTLLPGFMLDGATLGDPLATLPMDAEIVDATICPIGYYSIGGSMISCRRCPYDTTTKTTGATSVDECLVPPGYYVKLNDSNPNTGVLEKCPTNVNGTGYYRANWVSFSEAKGVDGTEACTPCGSGILSAYRDWDEIGDGAVVMAKDPQPGRVAASSASCYINPGWGMTFDPVDFTKFRGYECPANTYGVTDVTYGLWNSPCKACTRNLQSAVGSSSFEECKNPVGFGYTSEGANQCPDGFYTAEHSMEPCTQCPPGRTTDYVPGNGIYQASIHDCKIPAGLGIFSSENSNPWNPANPSPDMRAEKCPVGYFSAGDTAAGSPTRNPACEKCPPGQSTSAEGDTLCDVCAPGYGIPACKPDSQNATDCQLCDFGTFQTGGSLRCSPCPQTPFNHPVGDKYVSYGITFSKGLISPETCVPRYSQLPSPAGARLAVNASLFTVTTGKSLVECIESCPDSSCCISQYEVEGDTCKQAVLQPLGPEANAPRLYYKLPPSSLIAAAAYNASSTKVWGKTQPAGVYARCLMDDAWVAAALAGLVGTSTNPTLVEETDLSKAVEWGECASETACRLKCETNAACWGFIHVPGKGWATRGGEDQIGVRSFIVSPDFARVVPNACSSSSSGGGGSTTPTDPTPQEAAPVPLPNPTTNPTSPNPTPAPVPNPAPNPTPDAGQVQEAPGLPTLAKCPAGFGNFFDCKEPCRANTFNDGTKLFCEQCPIGFESLAGASACTRVQPTKCPAGFSGLPDCKTLCEAGTFQDGSSGVCRNCTAGFTSLEGAAACNITIVTSTCKPGKGNAPRCNQCCRSVGKYNDGSFGTCQDCPDSQKPNKRADGCEDVIKACPPGTALNLAMDSCSVKCTKGTFQDGTFLSCIPCPQGQTSEDEAAACFFDKCPAGYGSVATGCSTACPGGLYNDGSLTECKECPGGRTSKDGKRCIFDKCPAGMAGDSCDIPCSRGRFQDGSSNTCSSCSSGKASPDARSCAFIACPAGFEGDDCSERCGDDSYNDGISFGTRCVSCPKGHSPNLDRSGCDDDNSDTECVARPTDSSSLTFECPTGWKRLPAGTYLEETAGCVTAVDAGSSCKEAWANLGSAVVGRIPALTEAGSDSGKLVCKCKGDNEGYVLKRQLDGSFVCAAEAAFLPNEGEDTDSPSVDGKAEGIWYDVRPYKSCNGAQQCWDMCFFCDGRPRYHAEFLSSQQKADGSTRFQHNDNCASTSSCKLDKEQEEDGESMPLFKACRLWSTYINHFSPKLNSLRALYDKEDDTNSFHTTKSGERIWPYRPRKTRTTQNLIMYGLQSQSSAKCRDCFDRDRAQLVSDVLVRYG